MNCIWVWSDTAERVRTGFLIGEKKPHNHFHAFTLFLSLLTIYTLLHWLWLISLRVFYHLITRDVIVAKPVRKGRVLGVKPLPLVMVHTLGAPLPFGKIRKRRQAFSVHRPVRGILKFIIYKFINACNYAKRALIFTTAKLKWIFWDA